MRPRKTVFCELQTKRARLETARRRLLHPGSLDNGDLHLVEVLTALLAATDRALERLAAGTYGMCQVCGSPIEPERLEVIPAASLCRVCARKDEAKGPTRRLAASRRAEEASEPAALTTAA